MYSIITLIILAIASLICWMLTKNKYNCSDLDTLSFIVGTVSLGLLITFCFGILHEQVIGRENCLSYYVDKQYYESACNNPTLTAEERTQVISMVINDNKMINNTKLWRNNKWLNWFNYAPLGDLPLFDITKIKYVNSKNTADYNVNINK